MSSDSSSGGSSVTYSGEGEDEFHRLLGQVVDVSAQIEMVTTSHLAAIVSHGDARLGLLIVGGQPIKWTLEKLGGIGRRFPTQLPGLAEWAQTCQRAFELRNRLVHDWLADDQMGDRTAFRFRSGQGLEQRPKALAEVKKALEELKRALNEEIALFVRLQDRPWKIDPDGG